MGLSSLPTPSESVLALLLVNTALTISILKEICLARFEPESVVNRLPCGHLFHQSCVERWIEYRNNTCPLCRSHLLPADNLGQQNSVFVSGARPQL
ncbi:probable E3 ubiquitin-protein ligase XERICO [Phalaenopsis equestris]|uniref:probable E3 ubiquitin-protein ligase XERICO n=1 Tax=Phalaenopsis equestris TaxID=78828 RepID=UPI0009E4DDC0|nr:probable E3 ubiquitin-protein ligase XERICO [Phalaenopsis equestris]